LSSSYPIYDTSQQLKGVIGIDLILSQVSTFLSEFKPSPSSKTFILEKDRTLVASSESELPFKVVKGQAHRLNASESADPLIQATTQYLTQYFGRLGDIQANLSSKQFLQLDLLEQIDRILSETGLSPQNLKLEITESLFMTHTEAIRFKLRRLRNQGIQLSIDDFGTGYSSLSYLHRFPINTLKIDRSFISHLGSNGENLEIIEAITVLNHKLGMSVVAEGVETAEQMAQVRAIGCEQVQGYFFSPPIAANKMAEFLDREVMHKTIYT
jgi:EAL domain-containing protein (putative c-di-GMP-specific phosphodiesterase class I)